MSDMERLRTEPGCHKKGLRSRQGGWVVRHSFCNERGEAHFLEHIQVIVRCRPICADANVESSFEHLHHGCKTRGQFKIGGWIMCYARARVHQRAYLASIHMDTMRRDNFRLQESLLLHVGDNRD